MDLLFVHYLYGAVKAMLPDGEPRLQLGLLRHLAGRSLLPDAVNQALHFRSDSADSAFVRALQTAETIGARDAANICSGPKSGSLELIEPNVNPKSRAR
ncbi:hypothetical protein SAMN05216337_1007109 [Bradyrhizobium brasilense]|uniref:Uncharacterized protein n=1 Tax=Bradyrhizobium brasilense TaxID=1419277 RepID=A0A1G6RSW4_9BRAD|nr:hypothetical protein SAMN05216337_1007109 [Bradyrhizobium brasilense]